MGVAESQPPFGELREAGVLNLFQPILDEARLNHPACEMHQASAKP